MQRIKKALAAHLIVLTLLATSVPAYSQQEGGRKLMTPFGDVAFEIVGQVAIPSPTTSKVYGYLSLINGLSANQIFTTSMPAAQNQTTALFTFFTQSITERVIVNGSVRVINRTGTTTIYFDETPDGDFADPDTFRNGTPVLVLAQRQHVIVDLTNSSFTVTDLDSVTLAEPFLLDGESLRLGKVRDQFRVLIVGPINSAPPPNGFLAGSAVAIEPIFPKLQ